MDWSNEVLASVIWLAKAFCISMAGLTVLFIGLMRFTQWGRQFSRITLAYFSPSTSKKPLLWLLLIVLITLISVRLNVLFSFWYNGFYSAMQKLDAPEFWFMLVIFSILATVHVVRTLINAYLNQAFMIQWRLWLTNQFIDQWLEKQSYYRTQFVAENADNPDQRIQQDVDSLVNNSLTLATGLLNAIVSLFSFTLILWGLSGPLMLFHVELPRAMVFLGYLYVIVATTFAVKIGRPLINLSFLNEKFNADFRYLLVRVREYGESIAFYRGEAVERSNLTLRFNNVISNMWAIVFRSLKFQGFNLAVSQTAVVFPFIVQAQRLMNKQLTLGDVMQTVEAFNQVQDALSFFRTSYSDFASYRAVLIRLNGFLDAIESVSQLPQIHVEYTENHFSTEALTVRTPHNTVLIENLDVALTSRQSLLIRGKSGAGKTTLLRAIAGLWPHVSGKISRPTDTDTLFLSQKPYLPIGTLREALFYPADCEALGPKNTDIVAPTVLTQCQLGHLIPHLDETDDWSHILSLGEQQRLAIGRILINRPRLVFLDEASSAMDEGLEHAMYQLIKQQLPEAIMISVGHRTTLLTFHQRELILLGEGKWQL